MCRIYNLRRTRRRRVALDQSRYCTQLAEYCASWRTLAATKLAARGGRGTRRWQGGLAAGRAAVPMVALSHTHTSLITAERCKDATSSSIAVAACMSAVPSRPLDTT